MQTPSIVTAATALEYLQQNGMLSDESSHWCLTALLLKEHYALKYIVCITSLYFICIYHVLVHAYIWGYRVENSMSYLEPPKSW
jgi:hypothetical protein